MNAGTIMKYSFAQSHFRCMKYMPTSVAFTTATARMMMKLKFFGRTSYTRNDTAVKTANEPNTTRYALVGSGWCSPCASVCSSLMTIAPLARSDQVQQREQEDPHDIDEVPVQADQLQHEGVLDAEPADEGHQEDDGEDHDPAEDVQGVEPRHGEVARRPQVAVGDGRRQVQRVPAS